MEIRNIEYNQTDFKEDYIVLRNVSDENINITSWTIRTNNASVDIPQAVKVLSFPFTSADKVDIVLAPNDELVAMSGNSPSGVNFLTNKCTDYLDEPPNTMKKHCFLTNGDILISLTGNVGRVCGVGRFAEGEDRGVFRVRIGYHMGRVGRLAALAAFDALVWWEASAAPCDPPTTALRLLDRVERRRRQNAKRKQKGGCFHRRPLG